MAQFLPDLPMIEIFRHLDFVDLARARMVNRSWRALIDDRVKIDGLIISPYAISTPENWFLIGKVGRDSLLRLDVNGSRFKKFNRDISELRLLDTLKRFKVIQRLTRSEITDGYDLNRLFSMSAKFPALEQLEMVLTLEHAAPDLKCSLVHPNLKVLSLDGYDNYAWLNLEIDCSRLETLQCYWNFKITFTHPESIKQLHNYSFREGDSPTVSSSDLQAFANLELYVCDAHWVLEEEVEIWSMPKLTELRVEEDDWREVQGNREPVRSLLTGYMAMKNHLESTRGKVRIFLNDVECSTDLRESHPFLFAADEN